MASAADAVAWADGTDAPVDLLLTDVVMPGMNGKDLRERLAQTRPDLTVLFMSAYAADVLAHRGVLDGETAFIHKPFTIESLTQKVRQVLDRTITLPPARDPESGDSPQVQDVPSAGRRTSKI